MKTTTLIALLLAAALTACQKETTSDTNKSKGIQNSTGTRGGGDTDVVAFIHYSHQIVQWMQRGKSELSNEDVQKFSEAAVNLSSQMDRAQGPTIVFTTENLNDPSGAPKMAIYDRPTWTVRVQRSSWSQISTQEKYVLVALEIMGLADLEGRYRTAPMIQEHIHEISGIPTDADAPHLTRAGIVFSTLDSLDQSIPFLRLTSGFPWKKQDFTLTGAGLVLWEMDRVQEYDRVLSGFYSLPNLYVMDVLTSSIARYDELTIDGRGHLSNELVGCIKPLSLQLSVPIFTYLKQASRVMENYLAEKSQMQASTIEKIQDLKGRIDALLPSFNRIEVKNNIQYYNYTSPYAPYYEGLIGSMRSLVLAQGCRVPSTFKTSVVPKDVEKLLHTNLADPNADFKPLKENAEQKLVEIQAEVQKIRSEWSALAQKDNLKSIRFHDVVPRPQEDMVAGTAALIEIASLYIDRLDAKLNSTQREEVSRMEEILQGLKSGQLCEH